MTKTITAVEVGVHPVEAGQSVRARATIGNGQKGGWVMLLDGVHVGGGTDPAWVVLGDGAVLRGKMLEVSAVMTDVRAETDRLNLDVEVTGPGRTDLAIANTGKNGDSAAYTIVVIFS